MAIRLDEKDIRFIPLSEVKGDIISRVKYPTNESTLNGANCKEAVSRLTDGTNNFTARCTGMYALLHTVILQISNIQNSVAGI